MAMLSDSTDPTSLEDEYTKKRRALLARARELQGQIQTDSVAPVISTKGPDPHVLAGRQERAVKKSIRAASVMGASAGMSEADIRKLERANNGKSLIADTPGIDAYRSENTDSAIAARQQQKADRAAETAKRQNEYQSGMRSRVSSAAAAARARRAPVPPPAPSTPDAYSRMRDLAPSLRPGDQVGVKDGNQVAAARKNPDGTFDVAGYQSTPGTKISAKPGTVINPGGKRVPIADEISRMEKDYRAAGELANQNAMETAAVIQKNQDSNPAVRLAQRVAGFQDQQSQKAAASDPYRPMVASASRSPMSRRIRGARSTI